MKKGYIEINQDICKGCGICIFYCPKNMIVQSDTFNPLGYLPASFIDDKECNGCGVCAIVCPEVVIEVYRG